MEIQSPYQTLTITEREVPRFDNQTVHYKLDFNTNIHDTHFANKRGERLACPSPAPPCSKQDNPLEWPATKKTLQLIFAMVSVTCSSLAASSYSPIADQIAGQWGVSQVANMCGIFAFTMGFAIAPMFAAPFSEFVGRRRVVLASGAVFLASTLGCGLTRSFYGLIIARFFTGVGSSTYAMGNGIITDLYVDEDRNTPMAIFSGCATFGIGLGAIISGFIADYTSWRWTFYSQSIFLALSLVVQFSFFQETRSNVLLQRRCKAWNKWMEEQEHKGLYVLEPENEETKVPARIICARWKPKIKGDEKEKPLKEMMKASLILPFRMLFSDDILWPVALWAAFSWSVLYVCLSAVMTMFKSHYRFTISQSNAIFASECSGAVVAVALGIWQEHFGWKHWMLRGQPEDRLYFARVECMLLPIGLLIFGWAGEKGAHWSIPAVGMGIATIGITMVYLSVFNYFADAYGRHASTAIAAQNLVRNGLCGCFPLFTNQMFARLGYGWACTIFSGIGVVLCVLPCLLKHFGPRARLRSKYAVSPDNPKKPSIASDSTGASDSSGVV